MENTNPPLEIQRQRLLQCDNTTPELTFEGTETVVRVTDVYDGDTLVAVVDIGENQYRRVMMRLAGIDTPELRSKYSTERTMALSARNRVLNWLLPDVFAIDGKYTRRCITAQLDHSPALVTARLGKFDKYGRVLCRIIKGSECLNDMMVQEKYARSYDGRGKGPW
jgi:micrococcal nuclease